MMTYADLKAILNHMSEDDLGKDATIFVPGIDEYYPVAIAWTNESCDVLDPGHPVLTPD